MAEMLVFMIVVMVVIGVAYADYCLVDNTAHFGICFGKLAEAEETREAGLKPEAVVRSSADPSQDEASETPAGPPGSPAPAWLLLDLEPVLELYEG